MKKRLPLSLLLAVSFLFFSMAAFAEVVFMKDGTIKEYKKVEQIKVKNTLIKVIAHTKDGQKEEIALDSFIRIGSSSVYEYNVKYYLYKFKPEGAANDAKEYEAIEGYIVADGKDSGRLYTLRKDLNSAEEFDVKKFDIKYITTEPSPKGPKVKQTANEIARDVLGKKNESWFITPLPFALANTDNGVYPFLRVYVTDAGSRKDDNWIYTPYRWMLTAQVLFSTLGWQYHFIEYDQPFFLGTKLRFKTSLIIEDHKNKSYYGTGDTAKILTDRIGTTYTDFTQFDNFAIGSLGADGKTRNLDNVNNYKYHKYQMFNPKLWANVYYNILNWLQITGGVEYKYALINTWNGKYFDYNGTMVLSNPTLLEKEGFTHIKDGGSLIQLKGGIGFDTRDYEPDPKWGIYAGLKGLWGWHLPDSYASDPSIKPGPLGAFFHRYTLDVRGYFSIKDVITFALKLGYTTVDGGVPFYEMSNFEFFGSSETGVGGYKTNRGVYGGRFIDKTMMVMQGEIRWHIIEFRDPGIKWLWGFKLLAFIDVGRTSESWHGVITNSWDNTINANNTILGYGGGLIIAMNQSLLLHLYLGWSNEGMSFDFNVGHSI